MFYEPPIIYIRNPWICKQSVGPSHKENGVFILFVDFLSILWLGYEVSYIRIA